jgi:hypothetical protein
LVIIVNNANQVPREEPGYNPLFKLQPMLTMITKSFLEAYEPKENLSLDEGTCAFKGRVRFKVYNPKKPNKFGIKLYQLCESESGYTICFVVYTSDDTEIEEYAYLVGADPGQSTTTKLVVGLLAKCGLLGKGYKVYMDNYYNSVELAEELNAQDTYLCGTLRVNRKETPLAVKSKIKLQQGDGVFRCRNNVLVIKYHDKRAMRQLWQ